MSTNRSNYMKSYMKAYNADPEHKRKKMLWMRHKRAGLIHTHRPIGCQRWQEIVKTYLVAL